uniref:Ribosomal protein L10e/L16 domain-containing protein n=1 Tax=Chelydra serpentina TaxID=8475 RepID=A0A8C3SRA3_CHESE
GPCGGQGIWGSDALQGQGKWGRCLPPARLKPHGPGRLQTGMRGAFGKPQGTVARVHIGQVIMSIRTKAQNKEHVVEALRRAKFKFPGRQKIHISKKWGFTKFNADEFEDMVAEKRLLPDGCGVKYIPSRGPLDKWRALHAA